ncbi:MAG: alpha/beta fold hydrolase [Xanthobacteraceae bacterium]
MRTIPTRFWARAFVLAAACLAVLRPSPAAAQSAFYQATDSEISGPVGSLIRKEPRVGAPAGATAYKVLYRSTKPDGTPIAVSGIVIVPAGQAPAGGWPIVAWAHPTTGVVSHCAPSLALFVFQQIAGSRRLLENGYAIAATDYPGLGTPGPHPYLVGDSEAHAVIDSVRAARSFPGLENSTRYTVWGHSQGGQAALFTGMIAKAYAPELQLVGVAAAAPATDLAALMTDDLNTAGGRNLTAMTMWSWARVFNAPINEVVEPAAMATVNALANECIEGAFDLYVREKMSAPLATAFLSVKNPATIEPWKSLLAQNTAGDLPPDIPLFLSQGLSDGLVRPAVTQAYKVRLCKAGSKVKMLLMPGVSHGFIGYDSADAAADWMADRFQGYTPPSDC